MYYKIILTFFVLYVFSSFVHSFVCSLARKHVISVLFMCVCVRVSDNSLCCQDVWLGLLLFYIHTKIV